MTNEDKPIGRHSPRAVELDGATKARIRAEEVERAKVRAELEGQKAAPVQQAVPVQQKGGGLGFFGWSALALIGIVVVVVMITVNSANSGAGNTAAPMKSTASTAVIPDYTVAENLDESGTLAERIIVTAPANREGVAALLNQLMPSDHNGNVWAYLNKTDSDEGGAWVGMLHKDTPDASPVVSIDDKQLARLVNQ